MPGATGVVGGCPPKDVKLLGLTCGGTLATLRMTPVASFWGVYFIHPSIVYLLIANLGDVHPAEIVGLFSSSGKSPSASLKLKKKKLFHGSFKNIYLAVSLQRVGLVAP